ncbi:MAG: exodeoxyribonuclease V subunit gamma [Desulfobacterales bacterium]|nr:exodeoxyribonuclease V subunit gamma [Desulfobacterales bacterium]
MTFCAMLPMRTIPFKVVCLVGHEPRCLPARAPGAALRPDGQSIRAAATARAATTTNTCSSKRCSPPAAGFTSATSGRASRTTAPCRPRSWC